MAAKMKVSRSLVGNWEQAKTRVLTNDLEALAAALLTSRAYLVGRPNVVVKMENLIHTDGGVLVDVEHLVRLRDRQEQVMLDAFRAISDGQRVLVLQLTHELAGSG